MYSKRHLTRKLRTEKGKYVQKLRKENCEKSNPAIMEVVEVASEKNCEDVEINYSSYVMQKKPYVNIWERGIIEMSHCVKVLMNY